MKYDKEINDLLNNIDNIPKEQQIERLRNISNMIVTQKEHLENSFIVGTFISGCGFGIMSSSNNLIDFYLSLGIMSTGVIISLASSLNINKRNYQLPKVKKKSK